MNLMSHNSTYSIRIQIFIANNDEFTGPTLEPLSLSPDVLRCRWCFGAWSVVLLVGLLASGWSFRLVPQAGPSGWDTGWNTGWPRLEHWLEHWLDVRAVPSSRSGSLRSRSVGRWFPQVLAVGVLSGDVFLRGLLLL